MLWYVYIYYFLRFSLPAGTMMAKQPPTDSCGSGWGGWVYGDHPATNGEIVRRSVCFKGFGKTKCLPGFWTYHYLQENILIKNCGNFFAYFLTDTSGSWHARYCGGTLLTISTLQIFWKYSVQLLVVLRLQLQLECTYLHPKTTSISNYTPLQCQWLSFVLLLDAKITS